MRGNTRPRHFRVVNECFWSAWPGQSDQAIGQVRMITYELVPMSRSVCSCPVGGQVRLVKGCVGQVQNRLALETRQCSSEIELSWQAGLHCTVKVEHETDYRAREDSEEPKTRGQVRATAPASTGALLVDPSDSYRPSRDRMPGLDTPESTKPKSTIDGLVPVGLRCGNETHHPFRPFTSPPKLRYLRSVLHPVVWAKVLVDRSTIRTPDTLECDPIVLPHGHKETQDFRPGSPRTEGLFARRYLGRPLRAGPRDRSVRRDRDRSDRGLDGHETALADRDRPSLPAGRGRVRETGPLRDTVRERVSDSDFTRDLPDRLARPEERAHPVRLRLELRGRLPGADPLGHGGPPVRKSCLIRPGRTIPDDRTNVRFRLVRSAHDLELVEDDEVAAADVPRTKVLHGPDSLSTVVLTNPIIGRSRTRSTRADHPVPHLSHESFLPLSAPLATYPHYPYQTAL